MRSVASYFQWARSQDSFGARIPARFGFGERVLGSDVEAVTIAQIVSISEQFSVSRLFSLVESRLDGSTDMALRVWEQSQDSIESSWDRQAGAWNTYAQIRIKAHASFKALDPFIEVRNAVMHGLGHLTRRQQRRAQSLVPTLVAAGITVDGTRLTLERVNVVDCREVTVAFIEWLDRSAPH
jgi:hypothetical protein